MMTLLEVKREKSTECIHLYFRRQIPGSPIFSIPSEIAVQVWVSNCSNRLQ
uniref:Uncharacterized protein n=1 Tax=Kalanchoe fedtschenkoi TaxID=63787 RepID=A0A7N0UEA6_KALFE